MLLSTEKCEIMRCYFGCEGYSKEWRLHQSSTKEYHWSVGVGLGASQTMQNLEFDMEIPSTTKVEASVKELSIP